MVRNRNPSDEALPLTEHLGELRRRIIYCLIALGASTAAGLFLAGPVIRYLKSRPPVSDYEWLALSPWEPIRLYMMIALVFGLAFSLPFILWQLWLFVSPGLRVEERRAAVKYIPGAVVLFLIGLAFAYYIVFPMAFYFATNVSRSLGLSEMFGIAQYFSFMLNIVLPMSLLFELPIVVMFLTRIRVLNPARLRKMRRYAYLVLLIVSTMVTPPDVISDILVTVPLILLYEFSVMLSGWVYKRQLAADEAWEREWAAGGSAPEGN